MRITIKLLVLILIFGCKNQSKKTVLLPEIKTEKSEKQSTESIYNLIINKKESLTNLPDSIAYTFDFSKRFTEKEVSVLNLDTTKIDLSEYYFLTNQKFLKKEIDSISFTIYYQHKYGDQLKKILRIQRPDKIFDLTLAMSGGDSDTYSLSTEFLNDSIFKETIVHKSTAADDTYLNAYKIDSIIKTYSYSNQFKLIEKSLDSIKIRNTAFVDYPIEEISSNRQLSYKDSLDLLLFWRKTASIMLDTINSNLSNSKINNLLYDSFDGKGGLFNGGVYHSPDGLFKILVVGGESCGAYCNPFWESELILSNGKRINNLDFSDIEQIHLMEDGKYLILEESSSRPASVFSETTKSAILFSIDNDEMKFYPFNYSHPKYNDGYKKISFSQEHFIDEEQYLRYDKESKKLSYRYGTDFTYCCQIDSTFVYKGEFEYTEEGFILLKEERKYIKVE